MQDPWKPIRAFIDDFNNDRQKRIIPGEFLVVDECMSFWEGLDNIYSDFGLPHSSKQIRKPRSQGCELKSCADCETGIMLRLEILEGKDRQATKAYVNEYPPSTAVVLRLTEPWFEKSRTIIGDSAFSSVATAEAALKVGLHYLGVVKTASKRYPKAQLLQWASDETLPRGFHKTLRAVTNLNGRERPMYAVCWKDKLPKCLICTRGTTLPGNPIIRKRFKAQRYRISRKRIKTSYNLIIQRPKVVEMYFNSFPTIDIHDHLRQGSLCMEESWRTKIWWHRLFATVLGMIFVDSFRLYQFSYTCGNFRSLAGSLSFSKFLHRLVYSLSKFDAIERQRRSSTMLRSLHASEVTTVSQNSIFLHISIILTTLPRNDLFSL